MKFWTMVVAPITLFLLGLVTTCFKSSTLILVNQILWFLSFLMLLGVICWVLNHLEKQLINLSTENANLKPFKIPISEVKNIEGVIATIAVRLKDYENERWKQTAKQAGGSLKLMFDSSIDGLTGLSNRKYLDTRFPELISNGTAPLSVIMLDIDHFKKVNDTYGHQVGDEVLQHFARMIKSTVRPEDMCFRYGGEEFTVILKSNLNTALITAERIRQKVEVSPAITDKGEVKITASLGVASYRDGDTPDSILERADKALYQAKEGGRNQVVKELNED